MSGEKDRGDSQDQQATSVEQYAELSTEVFQSLLPSSEWSSYCEDQGEDNGDTQQGKIHIIFDTQSKGEIGDPCRDDYDQKGAMVQYG